MNKFCADRSLNVKLTTNKNTFKCVITTTAEGECWIDFRDIGSIGPLLGFDHRKLKGKIDYISHKLINIQGISALRVHCDLTTGAYHNGRSSHTIYEFSPTVGPGYKITEQPVNLIYLPINRKSIDSIYLSVCDQNDNLVDFRGETITCRVHIKRDNQ